MSNYLRPGVPGATIFFTVRLAERGSALLTDEIDRLRSAVGLTLRERPVAVRAWIVLPDHMHCIWTLPEGDRDFPVRWGAIKARFSRGLPCGTRRLSHLMRREKAIWQRRFWEHHIRDRQDLDEHIARCWNDPVRHGLVERPQDWPFSSFQRNRFDARVA